MNVPAALATLVRERAEHRCEYCRMSQSLQGATFHVEHIIPLTCGGSTTEDNLALACPSCNLHKSDRSHAVDPETLETAPLFHPRRQLWAAQFAWNGTNVTGITATGRATIGALDLNHPRRLRVREAESLFGLFPPVTSDILTRLCESSGKRKRNESNRQENGGRRMAFNSPAPILLPTSGSTDFLRDQDV